jgi:CRISPR system Cascade subunit CasE
MRKAWGDIAPTPFVVRTEGKRTLVFGYGVRDASVLRQKAMACADPYLRALFSVQSKLLPAFSVGQELGLQVCALPVTRLWKPVNGYRAGAEVDAFLARCAAVGSDTKVNRVTVYEEWLARQINPERTGFELRAVQVEGYQAATVYRRTQGATRTGHRVHRFEAHYKCVGVVRDPSKVYAMLRRGIGRDKAFGYGAVFVTAPGAPYMLK